MGDQGHAGRTFTFTRKWGSERVWREFEGCGALTEEEQDTIAEEIVELLELANWKIEAGSPLGGHGPGLTPKE